MEISKYYSKIIRYKDDKIDNNSDEDDNRSVKIVTEDNKNQIKVKTYTPDNIK